MSIEFSRELLKAYRATGDSIRLELCKAVRDHIFWGKDHPCCVIDVKDTERSRLVHMIDYLDPLYILLLGTKVRKKIPPEEIESSGRFAIPLGFPRGKNQRRNVMLLADEDDLCQLLAPKLAGVEEEFRT